MLDNELLKNVHSWPFDEAQKILNRLNKLGNCALKTDKKNALLETGYGPSGLPHIGTFGEVLRTTFVLRAFQKISNIDAKIIAFSDDMDGLRRVPTNVPNQEMLQNYIDIPLTSVPDPFEKSESFAHHNNGVLCKFLDSFGFQYEFKSSTQMYRSGVFNNSLLKILENYDEIMNIMLPSLREERRKTYSPFLPICPKTGKILQVFVEEVNLQNKSLIYKDQETGLLQEVSILDGNCKLQWKADWGMRWHAFGVDYEMHGKDLIESFKLSSKICTAIGGTPPAGLTYELFLDEEGKKISKSKGNGLSMDEWLKYAPAESLSYYMYQSPKRAKRLYFDIIPLAVDEYIDSLNKFSTETKEKKLDNPVYHIHNGEPPVYAGCLKFSLLLNLVQSCGSVDEQTVMEFIKRYASKSDVFSDSSLEFMNKMAKFTIAYYQDFVANSRVFKAPDDVESLALKDLALELGSAAKDAGSEEIQGIVFAVGKKFFIDNLKGWFQSLYEILFGNDKGPRMGTFIFLYGIDDTISLIESRLKNEK